ncbi:hypothetical protein [uncultured Clostridium sp.]|uniref:hypothetical protein n=1 Tax=uncultured Clostridium sp. TaxID=59620 RepID=UPI0025F2B9AA|nr:hypothetical protein [uncultured Clostridium sp.]
MKKNISKDFTTIYNSIIRTERLDTYQKSCIYNILSNEEDFKLSLSNLSKRIPCSKRKAQQVINSLKKVSIISVVKVKTINGDWDSNSYLVDTDKLLEYIGVGNDMPNVGNDMPNVGNDIHNGREYNAQQVGHDVPTKNKRKNKNIENNIYSDILEFWISKNIKKHRSLTNEMKKSIDKTLKDYSKDELLEAINNYGDMYNDSNYQWCNYQWGLNEFLVRKDKDGVRQLGLFLNEGSKYLNYLKFINVENKKIKQNSNGQAIEVEELLGGRV